MFANGYEERVGVRDYVFAALDESSAIAFLDDPWLHAARPEDAASRSSGAHSKSSSEDASGLTSCVQIGNAEDDDIDLGGTQGDRQKRNAEACRKSRRKRKAAMENLRKRNEELEEARDVYLERIAELQLELGSLQHGTSVDIARENELLRAEINKHKASIARILRATQKAPEMLHEERIRLLETGIENSLGQILGLTHVSSGWPMLPVYKSDLGIEAFARQQFFPENVPVDEMKRWSARIDFCNLPVEARDIHEQLWNAEINPEEKKKIHEGDWCDGVKRTVEAFPVLDNQPDIRRAFGNRLVFTKYTETAADDPGPTDFITMRCSNTRATKVLVPRAILPDDQECLPLQQVYDEQPEGTRSCYVTSTTEFTKDLLRARLLPTVNDYSKTGLIWGYTCVPCEPAIDGTPRCHVILIFSAMLGHLSHMDGAEHLMPQNGSLPPNWERFMDYNVAAIHDRISKVFEIHQM
mmetsp:Transcript_10661/g.20990  ORF Transcript_10661/g.20990 Transcript_10661/m.20990 type:complete len:469 (-) Transcript_10661:529-1935(-)